MKNLYWVLLSGCMLNGTEPSPYTKKQSIIPVLFPEEYRPKDQKDSSHNLEQSSSTKQNQSNNDDVESRKCCNLEYFREKLEEMSREIRSSQFVLPLINNGQISKAQYPDTCNKHNRFLLVALSRLLESKPSKSLEHCLYNIERALIAHSKLPSAIFFTDKDISSIKEMFEGHITSDRGGKFVLNFINAGYLKDYLNMSSPEDTDLRLGVQEVEKMVDVVQKTATGVLHKKLSVLRIRVKQFMNKYMKRSYNLCTYTTNVITKKLDTVSEFKFLNRYVNQDDSNEYGEISFYSKDHNKQEKVISYPVKYGMFEGGMILKCIEKQVTDLDDFMGV